MISAQKKIDEIVGFLTAFRFDADFLTLEGERSKQSYRRLHGLLIIELIGIKTSSDLSKAFLREAVGDASQAFLLSSCNFYKPALLSLRSSIENLMRYVVAQDGTDPVDIKTVYDLFKIVRAKYQDNPLATNQIGRLSNEYATLCESSHTVKDARMSGEIAFHRIAKYYHTKALDTFTRFSVTSTAMLSFCFIYFYADLAKIDVSNGDDLRRLVPRSLRRALST